MMASRTAPPVLYISDKAGIVSWVHFGGAWPDRGVLGAQRGPNKTGRK
jgi:hypothetical protein